METASVQGVGGRPEGSHPYGGGGGYLDICTQLEFPIGPKKNRADPRVTDPRLLALQGMRMHERWLRIASVIGMDNFLFVWEQLDRDVDRAGLSIWVSLPRFSRYMRHQRNRIISLLAEQGLKSQAIQQAILNDLGERISIRHIDRIRKRLKQSINERKD